MTLEHRLKRRLGYDTVTTITGEYPLYHYEVLHLNGKTSEDDACIHRWNDAALILETPDKETWNRLTVWAPWSDLAPSKPWSGASRGYDTVRELEGVQEVDREEIGVVRFHLDIDLADHTLLGVEKEVVMF